MPLEQTTVWHALDRQRRVFGTVLLPGTDSEGSPDGPRPGLNAFSYAAVKGHARRTDRRRPLGRRS